LLLPYLLFGVLPAALFACPFSPPAAVACAVQAAGDISYSIVRPTAFFKSLAGQVELVKQGKPYVMFGDGNLASCKPISEQDLARFMADCITGGGTDRCRVRVPCCAVHARHQQLSSAWLMHVKPAQLLLAAIQRICRVVPMLD
jgi:hypothetical protein